MKRKIKNEFEPLIPNAIGMQLSQEQIEEIAKTVYSRFYQQSDKPDWKSVFNDDSRKATIKLVKQVIDSLTICGFILIRD